MERIKGRFLFSIPHKTNAVQAILYGLFFVSGCAALIYQIMWQRMLFTLFGVDLESITIIVSVFMFGLGIGGLAGGWLADKFLRRLLFLYIAIEFCIASFGFISPDLIVTLGNLTISSRTWVMALLSFALFAIPTILMGATFPILVKYINQYDRNIGSSVGKLYFANTLGGALGAYYSGFVLLNVLGLVGAINCAACLNLAIAIVALTFFRKLK